MNMESSVSKPVPPSSLQEIRTYAGSNTFFEFHKSYETQKKIVKVIAILAATIFAACVIGLSLSFNLTVSIVLLTGMFLSGTALIICKLFNSKLESNRHSVEYALSTHAKTYPLPVPGKEIVANMRIAEIEVIRLFNEKAEKPKTNREREQHLQNLGTALHYGDLPLFQMLLGKYASVNDINEMHIKNAALLPDHAKCPLLFCLLNENKIGDHFIRQQMLREMIAAGVDLKVCDWKTLVNDVTGEVTETTVSFIEAIINMKVDEKDDRDPRLALLDIALKAGCRDGNVSDAIEKQSAALEREKGKLLENAQGDEGPAFYVDLEAKKRLQTRLNAIAGLMNQYHVKQIES